MVYGHTVCGHGNSSVQSTVGTLVLQVLCEEGGRGREEGEGDGEREGGRERKRVKEREGGEEERVKGREGRSNKHTMKSVVHLRMVLGK